MTGATNRTVANNPLGSYPCLVARTAPGPNQADCQTVGIDIGVVVGDVLTPSRVSASNPFPVGIVPSSSTRLSAGALTATSVSTVVATICAANSARRKFTINNNANTYLYVKAGTGATTGSFSFFVSPFTSYESFIDDYTGILTAITSSLTFICNVQEYI